MNIPAAYDEIRLLYIERRDWIDAYTKAAAKGDRLAMAHMAMTENHRHRLAIHADAGRILAAVRDAHQRDPDALSAVLRLP